GLSVMVKPFSGFVLLILWQAGQLSVYLKAPDLAFAPLPQPKTGPFLALSDKGQLFVARGR
ncbi:hypothetical protein DC364_23035, partial [Vibrio vulnificus]